MSSHRGLSALCKWGQVCPNWCVCHHRHITDVANATGKAFLILKYCSSQGGKKRCPIMMGFLVTVLSFLLPRAHLFMWRFDSLSPTKTKDNGKVVPVRALRGEHSSDTQA